jgi:hypothetical protein
MKRLAKGPHCQPAFNQMNRDAGLIAIRLGADNPSPALEFDNAGIEF